LLLGVAALIVYNTGYVIWQAPRLVCAVWRRGGDIDA